MRILFSVGVYDNEGDLIDDGDIYLHFDNCRLHIGTMGEFRKLIRELLAMEAEIQENYDQLHYSKNGTAL